MTWTVLQGLGEGPKEAILRSATRRRFHRGETLFHEGDPGDTFHLLAKGKVAIRVSTPMGDLATLTVMGVGDSFGEQALLSDGGRRTATVVALEAVETLALHRGEFERMRQDEPQVEHLLVAVLAAQVRRLSAQVLDALYVPAELRVVRRLHDVAQLYDDGGRPIVVPLTQEVLATMAGTTRPTANRALQQLEQAGIVTLGRGRVEIHDIEEVADHAR